MPASATEHLFTIPGGDAGISVWYGTEGLYGIAAMPDGTFWVGDWTKTAAQIGGRLLHYSRSGQLLTVTPAPGGSQDMSGMVRDLEAASWAKPNSGPNVWIIINRSVYKISPDGKVLATYPLPDEIDSRPVVSPALQLAPGGEVLITADDLGAHPAQLVDAAGRQATFTSDKSGKTDMPSLSGYPGLGGSLYTAALDPGRVGTGTIVVAGTPIDVKEPYSITALNILRVNRDGSLYVMAESDAGNGNGSGTSGRSEDARQTILLYGKDGQLKGRASLPFAGHFIDVVRQTATDDNGSIYVLYQSGRAEFSVERLNFYPPGALPPTPFIPTPTPTYSPPTSTPTPSGLQGLVTQAVAIADVQVTTSFTDTVIARVNKWLKPIEVGYKDLIPYNDSFLNVAGDPQELKLLARGNRYILFLASPYMGGDCPQVPDEFQLVAGKLGVIEVRGNRIGNGDLAGYRGMSLSKFEATIGGIISGGTGTAAPIALPDTGPADLLRLAHSAEFVAEVSVAGVSAGAGRYFYSYRVDKWLKKPAGFSEQILDMSFGKCEPIPDASGRERLILFINEREYKDQDGGTRTFRTLTGGSMGIVRIGGDGFVRWAGIGHYRGWKAADVEKAIRDAVRVPGTPDPKLVPPP